MQLKNRKENPNISSLVCCEYNTVSHVVTDIMIIVTEDMGHMTGQVMQMKMENVRKKGEVFVNRITSLPFALK